MLKRWAAWPPGIRWLVAIAAVTLAAAIVWALFVPLADSLARHDVGSATGTLHETARGGVIDVPSRFTHADLEAATRTGDSVLAAAAAAANDGQDGQITQYLAGHSKRA